ncbi:MAG: hypothetical protein IKG18_07905 [Atopobiaceae bacterium]|nr:hypothetical protein [Atopobiaceae bacterium]
MPQLALASARRKDDRLRFTDIGRWWGNDPAERSQAEIDVVALDDGTTVLVGECKWKGEKSGLTS